MLATPQWGLLMLVRPQIGDLTGASQVIRRYIAFSTVRYCSLLVEAGIVASKIPPGMARNPARFILCIQRFSSCGSDDAQDVKLPETGPGHV